MRPRIYVFLIQFLPPIRYDVEERPNFPVQKFYVGGISASGGEMARDGVWVDRQATDVPDETGCLDRLPLRV